MPRRKKQPPLSSDGKGAKCTWCQRTLKSVSASPSGLAATRDHVHPKMTGGTVRVWCCRACNQLKGSMRISEWKRFMRDNPEWWRLWHAPSAPRGAPALKQQQREAP